MFLQRYDTTSSAEQVRTSPTDKLASESTDLPSLFANSISGDEQSVRQINRSSGVEITYCIARGERQKCRPYTEKRVCGDPWGPIQADSPIGVAKILGAIVTSRLEGMNEWMMFLLTCDKKLTKSQLSPTHASTKRKTGLYTHTEK